MEIMRDVFVGFDIWYVDVDLVNRIVVVVGFVERIVVDGVVEDEDFGSFSVDLFDIYKYIFI